MNLRQLAASIVLSAFLVGCAQQSATNVASSTVAKVGIPQTTDASFERDVIDSDVPVLVDFYASWCQPCKRMEPVLQDLATMYNGKAKVVRVNVEENPELAKRFRITAIPHLMLFKNGDLVDDVLGMTSKERLSYSLERTL